jgi:hypothetical protein
MRTWKKVFCGGIPWLYYGIISFFHWLGRHPRLVPQIITCILGLCIITIFILLLSQCTIAIVTVLVLYISFREIDLYKFKNKPLQEQSQSQSSRDVSLHVERIYSDITKHKANIAKELSSTNERLMELGEELSSTNERLVELEGQIADNKSFTHKAIETLKQESH